MNDKCNHMNMQVYEHALLYIWIPASSYALTGTRSFTLISGEGGNEDGTMRVLCGFDLFSVLLLNKNPILHSFVRNHNHIFSSNSTCMLWYGQVSTLCLLSVLSTFAISRWYGSESKCKFAGQASE